MLNRIGDVGLALGIMTLFYVLKQPIMKPFSHTQVCLNQCKSITCFNYELDLLNFACIMLFIGAVGKSGQFGLHVSEAMNAPTPVSALLHAATMVKNSCHF
jgi:NADH-quinone oxidoreductase subunit L